MKSEIAESLKGCGLVHLIIILLFVISKNKTRTMKFDSYLKLFGCDANFFLRARRCTMGEEKNQLPFIDQR